jgi:putative ABC transport system substrate-binding protein
MAELVTRAPAVIVAATTPQVAALQQATRTVPIVFVNVVDPVGSGMVASLARPGGNITGFIVFEYALAAKWLQLLKEIAPNVTRTAVLRDPTTAAGIGQFAAIQAAASVDMELSVIDLRDADQIGRDVASFAKVANGGLIVTANQFGAPILTSLSRLQNGTNCLPFIRNPTTSRLVAWSPMGMMCWTTIAAPRAT